MHTQAIIDAHAAGKRADVTYTTDHGTARGLATHNPTQGVGPQGVLFVCVDSFANRVPMSRVTAVKCVER